MATNTVTFMQVVVVHKCDALVAAYPGGTKVVVHGTVTSANDSGWYVQKETYGNVGIANIKFCPFCGEALPDVKANVSL